MKFTADYLTADECDPQPFKRGPIKDALCVRRFQGRHAGKR